MKGPLYILLTDQVANRREKGLLPRQKTDEVHVTVLQGSLWYQPNADADDAGGSATVRVGRPKLTLHSIEFDGVVLVTTPSEVERLSEVDFELLIALPTLADRYKVFQDKEWLREGIELDKDSLVYVLNGPDLPERTPGKIRYKGPLPGKGGIWFGVELSVEYSGKGTSDGTFRKQVFFKCPADSAIFVAINKIRWCGDPSLFRERPHSPSTTAEAPYTEEAENMRPPLAIGERVIWMSDIGPESGLVKWIGFLHDTRDKEWTVGVEFDNAVGTGTGKYKNRQLFRAKQNHASLIPILGLIKESEFYGPTPPKRAEPLQVKLPDVGARPIPPARLRSRGLDRSSDGTRSRGKGFEEPDCGTNCGSLPRITKDYNNKSSILQEQSLPYQHPDKENWDRDRHKPFSNSRTSPVRRERDTLRRERDWESVPVTFISNPGNKSYDSHTSPNVESNHSVSIYDKELPELESAHENGIREERPDHGEANLIDLRSSDGGASVNSGVDVGRDGNSPIYELHHRRKDDTPDNPESAIHNLWRTQSGSSRSDSSSSKTLTSPIPGIHINSQPYQSGTPHLTSTDTLARTRFRDQDSDSGPKSLETCDIDTDLELGSMVEVVGNPSNCQYGVIRWLGYLNDRNKPIVGLEMEEENSACTDGTFGSRQLFTCPPRKAFFVYLHKCRPDPRFEESSRYLERSDSQLFGSMESPDISGTVAPPSVVMDVQQYCGKGRGIQGHHNSCYLDATLFSMFAFTMVFDTILYRPRQPEDLDEYDEVQRVLKDSIVNPLRKNFCVRADKVLKLRTLLDRLGSVKGLTTEEKDPEEFMNSLLQQIMRAEPFLKFSNAQESFFYQLFMEKDERLVLPTTQQLLGLSFLQSDIKLAEVPSCLILQMPRFGKNYKMYKRIVPSLYLDITDILEHGPRECTICGELANYECKECYTHFGDGLDQIAFCNNCLRKSHSHTKRTSHRPRDLKTLPAYLEYVNNRQLQGHNGVPIHRERMELFAVVCIETSHYVAFVKCGTGSSAPWVFFDSMADRMGEQHGYNVPEVREVPDMSDWLADHKQHDIMAVEDDKLLPEPMRRLLCDGYMCMYESTDTMMYK